MLSPSSLSQRRVSEDSSGSEAGSDVSLEPETDRFGFIVTDGSTAGSAGPSPELVRQREAKWINIMLQWDRILMKKSNKVKTQCQKGIPASLRAKCWPLLCGASELMKRNNIIYKARKLNTGGENSGPTHLPLKTMCGFAGRRHFCLKDKPGLASWVDVIERDLDRQFPFHEMFLSKDSHGQQGLFQVLKTYTQYQPQEGYCQAQGPVAAVLLMNMPAEEAFWCLVQISGEYLPGYYNPLLEGVLFDAALLTWALKKTCPAVHKHLQHHGVEPLMFATDWLMCLFARHLPFNTLLRVWDLFFCYGVRVLLQVAVVLVRRALGRADQRKRCQGQVETLESLRGVRDQIGDEDDAFVAEVFSVPLSAKDLEKQTEKEWLKWRKDRPSSTFDPRGRCQGYRMACARARQSHEEQERKERENGNLSVPLARSASTLSLSPSLLRKRWRKGGKVNTGDGERRGLVRHLSMGAKEDWRSWTEVNLKKVQCFQEEDAVSEGHEASSEGRDEETEKKESTIKEPAFEREVVKKQVEMVERRSTAEEESRHNETEEIKILLKHEEETSPDPINDRDGDGGNAEETTQCEREETPDTRAESESQPVDEDEGRERPGGDDEETSTAAVTGESESSSEEQETQSESKPEQLQSDSEARPDPESNSDGAESALTDKMETHHGVMTGTDEEKYHSRESVEEPGDGVKTKADGDEPAPTQKQTGEDEGVRHNAMAEVEQEDSRRHQETEGDPLIETSSEGGQEKPEPPFQNHTGSENTTTEPNEDRVCTSAQESEGMVLTAPSGVQSGRGSPISNQSITEEPRREAQDAESVRPAESREASTRSTDLVDAVEPRGHAARPASSAAEEPTARNPQESDGLTCAEPAGAPTPADHEKSQTDRSEGLLDTSLRAPCHHSRRFSGDFCIRKPSGSRGSKLMRRLSEDLFTTPRENSHSHKIHSQEEPHAASAVADETNPTDESEDAPAGKEPRPQPEAPKRLNLFGRLRRKKPADAKTKTSKTQVPKILIQDFSDAPEAEGPAQDGVDEKLTSRERRRIRRERERREKEEERERERKKKPQTRGKSPQREKGDVAQTAKTGRKMQRLSATFTESYF